MNKKLKLGLAFNTKLYVDRSWLIIFILGVFTLVYARIEPITEAVATMLLLFGSVLFVTLIQVRIAQKHGLAWKRVTIVLFGNIVERTFKSSKAQSAHIAIGGLLTHGLLAIAFGSLWRLIPEGSSLATEIGFVSIFNLILLIFNFLFRLTPQSDNLLYVGLSQIMLDPYPNKIMNILKETAMCFYAVAGIFILLLPTNSLLFIGWWYYSLLVLSRTVHIADAYGENREVIPMRNRMPQESLHNSVAGQTTFE